MSFDKTVRLKKTENIEQILKAVEIHEKIVRASIEIEKESKSYFFELSKFTRDYLLDKSKVDKINSYQIKSLQN